MAHRETPGDYKSMLVLGQKRKEKIVNLSEVKIGQVFRFASTDFGTALENSAFFMRGNPNDGEKRIYAQSLDGKERRLFDGERAVIIHEIEIAVFPNF